MQEVEEIMRHINPLEFFEIVKECSGEDGHAAIVHKDFKKLLDTAIHQRL